ncbi:hypothetical protein [Kineococcus sp. R86509]|uniref:hypothetical protein n=1 Tax=Kineococcus sp. R86509 TaxID=3093851 RepID=UPI0036D3A955
MPSRWADEPRWTRLAVTTLVLLLAWGCLQHLLDFATDGPRPYTDAPTWLATYWSALTALDPLAAVLLAFRFRTGVLLAPTILLTDVAANGYAIHVLDLGGSLAPIGQAVVSFLALASAALALHLLRPASSRSDVR